MHTDHLGQPRILTSNAGVVVWSAPVERPYGEVTETVAADPASGRQVVTDLRLPGQYDERLLTAYGIQGPYYNWNRWYLPSMGRYMEFDPIAVAGGFNGRYGPDWYGYAEGNPLRYVDVDGQASCSYSIQAHRLICVGDRLPVSVQLGPAGVFSGVGDCRNNSSPGCIRSFDEGPVVPGTYGMNPDDRAGHAGFWRLEPNPPVKGWEYYLRRKRAGFMLHPGSRSLGCITTDREDQRAMEQYGAVNELLWSEVGMNTLTVTP